MKVRNIEQFGGSIAFIVDDRSEDVEDAVMVDHYGSGQSLATPGFLISKEQGEKIIDAIKEKQVVMMNASLEIHNRRNEVEVGILYGSSLDLNADDLRAFTDLALESA